MRTFTQVVYGVFGAAAIVAAIGALVSPRLVTGDAVTPLTAHLMREQAAGFVFIGAMLFWCIRHFDQRRYVHLALLAFTTIFAGIHWADYLQSYRHVWSPIVNSIPSVLLALTAPRKAG